MQGVDRPMRQFVDQDGYRPPSQPPPQVDRPGSRVIRSDVATGDPLREGGVGLDARHGRLRVEVGMENAVGARGNG